MLYCVLQAVLHIVLCVASSVACCRLMEVVAKALQPSEKPVLRVLAAKAVY